MDKTQQMTIAECVLLIDTLLELEDVFKDYAQSHIVTPDALLTPACIQEIQQKREQRISLLKDIKTP